MPFSHWVFESLIEVGAIRDYTRTERSGKGKPPKGNLSVQVLRISELRNSADPGDQLWGLIGYAALQSEGVIGQRLKATVEEFCAKNNPADPQKLFKVMAQAADLASKEFKSRYKETPTSP
jgi:hypothetical protein